MAETPPDESAAACLFCDRSAHEILGESASWFIRLDNFPANPGHVQLVTKRHVESIFDLYGDEEAELHGVRLYARDLIVARLGHTPDGWTIGVNEGRAAGRSIDHIHEHLIPRYHGDVPDPRGGIRRAAPNCNPDAWRKPMPETAGEAPHELRDRLIGALTREHYRRAAERVEASLEEHCAAFADAILPIVQAERARAIEAERAAITAGIKHYFSSADDPVYEEARTLCGRIERGEYGTGRTGA